MADNVTTNSGSGGATFATDDIGDVHYPRSKLVWGVDGAAVDASASNPLPVVQTGTPDLPSGAATSANQSTANSALSAIQTAVEALDNAVSGTELQVDIVASIPAGTNNIGDVDIASIAAGDNNIGNVDVVTLPSLPAGTNNIGDVDIASIAAGDNNIGNVDVVTLPSIPAGTNNIGDVDVLTIAAGSNLIGDVGLSGARTSGGTTIFRSLDLDESEEDVKTSAGQIYWIHAMNLSTGKRYLKVYNATAANVTVGTTTPVLTFVIPTQGDTNGAGFTLVIPNGIAFSTAICVAATTGLADNDTGAPGSNDVVVNIGYA